MAPGPEALLTQRIKKALEKEFPSSTWIKIHGGPRQRAGVTDLIGCVSGQFIAMEIKIPQRKDKITKRQREFLKDVSRADGISGVVTSIEEAIDLVEWS